MKFDLFATLTLNGFTVGNDGSEDIYNDINWDIKLIKYEIYEKSIQLNFIKK